MLSNLEGKEERGERKGRSSSKRGTRVEKCINPIREPKHTLSQNLSPSK